MINCFADGYINIPPVIKAALEAAQRVDKVGHMEALPLNRRLWATPSVRREAMPLTIPNSSNACFAGV
jgi:hypothetical protein